MRRRDKNEEEEQKDLEREGRNARIREAGRVGKERKDEQEGEFVPWPCGIARELEVRMRREWCGR